MRADNGMLSSLKDSWAEASSQSESGGEEALLELAESDEWRGLAGSSAAEGVVEQ